jgi:hypothetical protein
VEYLQRKSLVLKLGCHVDITPFWGSLDTEAQNDASHREATSFFFAYRNALSMARNEIDVYGIANAKMTARLPKV